MPSEFVKKCKPSMVVHAFCTSMLFILCTDLGRVVVVPITSKVSRELSQTMLAQRTQDATDTAVLVLITTTQGSLVPRNHNFESYKALQCHRGFAKSFPGQGYRI